MVRLLSNSGTLRYIDLAILDLGYSISCFFSPNSGLKKGELVRVVDEAISYDFLVYEIVDNTVYLKLSLLEEMKTKSVKWSSKEKTTLSTLLYSLGLSYVSTRHNLTISNFSFLGTQFDLLLYISFLYELKFFVENKKLVFYKNTDTLGSKNHNAKIIGNNSTLINLSLRCFDFIGSVRTKRILHLPIRKLTIFSK